MDTKNKSWHEKRMLDFQNKFSELYLDPYASRPENAVLRLLKGNYEDVVKWIEEYGKKLLYVNALEARKIKSVIKKEICRHKNYFKQLLK